MADERALRHALVRFRGFRSHLFCPITEAIVEEYHSILQAIQEASDEDLSAYLIPNSMMRTRHVTQTRHPGFIIAPRFEAEETKYCDKEFFEERMEALWSRFGYA